MAVMNPEASRPQRGSLQVDARLCHFVERELLPGTGVSGSQFWDTLAQLIREFTPRNRQLLEQREQFQKQLDDWHRNHRGSRFDREEYEHFLNDIAYLLPEPGQFSVNPANVDRELALVAGPQLVVPLSNARYTLNAANARWGSLYDALYGSDVIPSRDGGERSAGYNPVRGARVIAYGRAFLDRHMPLEEAGHADVLGYRVVDGRLCAELQGRRVTGLKYGDQFAGYRGEPGSPESLVLVNHGLHVEIMIDSRHPVGRHDRAHISDIVVEAALSTIADCEDSVAAVDADDKVTVYRNWLGLMKGDLESRFTREGETVHRRLAGDRCFTAPDGREKVLPGRSLLLVRNTGLHMDSDAVLDASGDPVPEGILDGLVTTTAALHDLEAPAPLNSRSGSIYVVKPKLHGPEEVRFSCELFAAVERGLGLAENTVKLGLMDEERRMSLNLSRCMAEAPQRLIFINTGFLDRTGDEIHSIMEAGPVVRKAGMRHQDWYRAYEERNVAIGLAAGLRGRGQIGKGMWPMPDEMKAMMEAKGEHPRAGAGCAWVPSPTAATLHALHYHEVDVSSVQQRLEPGPGPARDELLSLPLVPENHCNEEELQQELDDNAQSLLGYVVRWVNHGIGCSSVPDLHDMKRMEDRATLRIASQHMANWLHHGVCSRAQVLETLHRMAAVVDAQNASDPHYRRMSDDPEGRPAFQAACELVLQGRRQPAGYTEAILHRRRRQFKAMR